MNGDTSISIRMPAPEPQVAALAPETATHCRCALLLLPGAALLSVAGVLEALQRANALQTACRYDWRCFTLEGQAPAWPGLALLAPETVPMRGGEGGEEGGGAALDAELLLVFSGEAALDDERLLSWLSRQAQRGAERMAIAGIDGGSAWLAAAGLLDGERATVASEWIEALQEEQPAVVWSDKVWEMNASGLLMSCAGGSASLDLMTAWLGRRHGERLAQDLTLALGLERARGRDERQRRAVAEQRGGSPKLAEALSLMEANLAEPLPTEEVARLVGVSRRQLERLFKQHLDALPSRYYLELRLNRARRLLQQGSQSILQIGLSCGFSSGPHFSNAYKAHFDKTPREERSQRAAAWRRPAGESPP
ncbi:GlxA family transcriptional regulator [Paucibacter sp. B51]|uniref:GlxA family transcriptional regulator n=1 Tax=Paucibacter sp. B51 TaxID=2993315 RepID=UPI0022EBABEB|nr:helix-turn-helix domain-containing protein [Paucibacter sp. B51]